MFGIAGIIAQQLAGHIRALTAVEKAFALAAQGDGTFSVEGMPVCLNTASAAAGLPVFASSAVQTAS